MSDSPTARERRRLERGPQEWDWLAGITMPLLPLSMLIVGIADIGIWPLGLALLIIPPFAVFCAWGLKR